MKTRVISGIVGVILGAIVVTQYYTILFDIAAFAVYAIAISEIYRTAVYVFICTEFVEILFNFVE